MASLPFAADEAVVAVAAAQRVAGVGAGQHVVAGVAVERRAGDLAVLREHRERVVAVAAVDDDGERAVGRHRLVAGRGAVPVRAAVEPAGRLAVHQQAAGHRHRHVVVGAVEVERRGRAVDRRRADRRVCAGPPLRRRLAPSAAASAANVVGRFTSSPLIGDYHLSLMASLTMAAARPAGIGEITSPLCRCDRRAALARQTAATSPAICSSCGVSRSSVDGSRRLDVSPVARSSASARCSHGGAPTWRNRSAALRRCRRAARRWRARRSHSPKSSPVGPLERR